MAQIILTFGLGKEKIKDSPQYCSKKQNSDKRNSRKDYNQKLGALAGIQGFAKEKVIYNGPDFPLEMIVFSGIDSAQIDSFLADYKQTGAQPVPLKAIITPQNIFWTVEALFKELWKEHLHFLPE